MSKKAILEKIQSFLVRLVIHLIKNQVEQRLTNSWAVSIRDSIVKIQSLNLKDNKKSYYIKEQEWQDSLEEALDDAIFVASIEVFEGKYNPFQQLQPNDHNLYILAQTAENMCIDPDYIVQLKVYSEVL